MVTVPKSSKSAIIIIKQASKNSQKLIVLHATPDAAGEGDPKPKKKKKPPPYQNR